MITIENIYPPINDNCFVLSACNTMVNPYKRNRFCNMPFSMISRTSENSQWLGYCYISIYNKKIIITNMISNSNFGELLESTLKFINKKISGKKIIEIRTIVQAGKVIPMFPVDKYLYNGCLKTNTNEKIILDNGFCLKELKKCYAWKSINDNFIKSEKYIIEKINDKWWQNKYIDLETNMQIIWCYDLNQLVYKIGNIPSIDTFDVKSSRVKILRVENSCEKEQRKRVFRKFFSMDGISNYENCVTLDDIYMHEMLEVNEGWDLSYVFKSYEKIYKE